MTRDNLHRQIADIAKASIQPGIYHGRLAEDYDGIGQYVLVSLSQASVSAAYKARVAAGDFGTGQTFPAGTKVSLAVYRGQIEVLSLGNKFRGIGDPNDSILCRLPTEDELNYSLDWEDVVPISVDIYPSGTGFWPSGGNNVEADLGPDGNPGVVETGSVFQGPGSSPQLPADPGQVYRWDFWALTNNAGNNDIWDVIFYNSSGAILATHHPTLGIGSTEDTWVHYVNDYTAPDNTAYMRLMGHEVAAFTRIQYDQVRVTGLVGDEGDGHVDIIGTGTRASRCGHAHHVLRTEDPTVTDDRDAGYPNTTLWTNTETNETFLLVDNSSGAADWRSWGILGGEEPEPEAEYKTIVAVIDGAGSEIADGIAGDIGPINFDGDIEEVTILADQTGSIVVDIWKDTYANFPPINADSITASAPVTISSSNKAQDTTLTGWTTAVAAGAIFRFNVDSCTTIERVQIALKVLVT